VLTRHRGIGSLFVGYRGLVKHFRIGKMVGQGLPSTQQSAFQSLPNGHLRVLYTVLLHCPALQPSTSTKRRISSLSRMDAAIQPPLVQTKENRGVSPAQPTLAGHDPPNLRGKADAPPRRPHQPCIILITHYFKLFTVNNFI